MTGDWGGFRNDLAKKVLTIDLNVTQTEQGRQKRQEFELGGRVQTDFFGR